MVLNALVPKMAEQLLEVPKKIPQDRILQQTAKQIVVRSEAKQADLAEAEKSLVALMTSQAVNKSSYAQVPSDHEASRKAFADELKALPEATQVLQSETGGADGQTYSLFQENLSAALQTWTDLKGIDMVTAVRRLAEQEHSAALSQLGLRISAVTKFGAGADDDPFVKVKDLIMAKASYEANQKSFCDEETSKTTEKKEDREAHVAKHSSKLDTAMARSIVLDVEISTLQSKLSVLLNRQLQMDIMCAVERYIQCKHHTSNTTKSYVKWLRENNDQRFSAMRTNAMNQEKLERRAQQQAAHHAQQVYQ